MGFFSNLFKKKSNKLNQEQLDQIEEKVEDSGKKHLKDKLIFSNLLKPSGIKLKNPFPKKAKKPAIRKIKKTLKKKVKGKK